MKRYALPMIVMLTALLLSACGFNILRGSGDVITETREVSGFDKVVLACSGDIILTQGEEESLKIEGEDNIVAKITTEVKDGTLYLEFENSSISFVTTERLKFYLTMDEITGLTITGSGDIDSAEIETTTLDISIVGSGDIDIDALAAKRLDVSIAGSGDLNLVGEVQTHTVNIAGSGNYEARHLHSQTVSITIAGSGDITVWAEDALDVKILGSGDVYYFGRPSVSQTILGSGDIISRGDK